MAETRDGWPDARPRRRERRRWRRIVPVSIFSRRIPACGTCCPLYMDAPLLAHLTPHLQRLGKLAGGRLNDLADQADKHPPVLHTRDKFGRDEEWIGAPSGV